MKTWKHSGFNVHSGRSVPPENRAEREQLCQYVLRNPFSVEKITLESPTDIIVYRLKLNPKINRNFEVFDPVDALSMTYPPSEGPIRRHRRHPSLGIRRR